MYLFEQMLMFLPVEYKRKLCFSIIETHMCFQQDEGAADPLDVMQIEQLRTAIHNHEIFNFETRGLTNTCCNPFEASLTPRH